jgi:hypothetical protein
MRRLIALGSTLLFLGVAPIVSAQAATVAAAGAIPNPWIGVFCGSSLSQNQPFHLIARGPGSQQPATGSMSVDTVDLNTCAPITLKANVACLLNLSGNQAVVWGPITSSSEPGFGSNYLEINVQDNRPNSDTGSINEPYFSEPPGNCADVGYTAFNYPFAYGGAAVTR